MTELTAITMAATACHSIGKRRDRSEKTRRLRINREYDTPDKPASSITFTHREATAPARIVRPIAL
ncbi:hypothetical protein [Bradyrhizobium manausense]|uniref:hypothetical protein n=1 Tax=Bradyrhizobium manausense TaxID=989370 RepID=UPI000A4B1884|nr:hypothetical protein [Bradyrhizobium manausense]